MQSGSLKLNALVKGSVDEIEQSFNDWGNESYRKYVVSGALPPRLQVFVNKCLWRIL